MTRPLAWSLAAVSALMGLVWWLCRHLEDSGPRRWD
jgi:hypothetical protein